MQGIITTFGIDWHLLLIQAINFGVLLVGLTYFLYTPIMRMLEARREKVAQGVADAERAHAELAEIEAARASKLAEAGHEADQVLSQAQSRATKKEREMMNQAEAAAASMLKEAEAQAAEAKARAITESKEEVAKMIVLGMERMMSK